MEKMELKRSKWQYFKKEWCKLVLFDKINLCFVTEWEIKQLDVVMFGFQLRNGIAIGVLGFIISFQWGEGSML